MIFLIMWDGSKRHPLLFLNISLAANFPTIFVERTDIAACTIAIGPYGSNDKPFVKGALTKKTLRNKLKDVFIPTWVAPRKRYLQKSFW